MVAFVIDASITLSWSLPDEISDDRLHLLQQVAEQGAIAPAIWPLEVANALVSAVNTGRIDRDAVPRTLAELESLPVQIDTLTAHHAWRATLRLASSHRLSTYDAAYLELASRLRLPLATLDARLAYACRAEDVVVLAAALPVA